MPQLEQEFKPEIAEKELKSKTDMFNFNMIGGINNNDFGIEENFISGDIFLSETLLFNHNSEGGMVYQDWERDNAEMQANEFESQTELFNYNIIEEE